MAEHNVELGETGLPYGSAAAEQMIADRIKRLEEKGYRPADRRTAIGMLAQEGNLRTEETLSGPSVSLAEAEER